MKRKRKIAALAMAVCICTSLLGGCGAPSVDRGNQVILAEEDNSQEIVIRFFAPVESASIDSIYYRSLIDQYNAQHTGISVVFEGISTADGFNEYLEERLDAGKGDDIFIVNADMVKPLYHKGYFYNLSTMPAFEELNDATKEQALIGEFAYCLPVNMTAYCMFVNQDVLNQYGLRQPENLEEFRTCCRTIKKAGGVPISLNRWYALTVPAMANGLYKLYGADNVEEIRLGLNRGDIAIGNYMLEGFQVMEEFIREGWYGDGLNAAAVDEIRATVQDVPDFASGKTAFYFGHLNAMDMIEKAHPNANYALQGVPIPGGTVILPAVETRLCVNAHSAYLEEALDFLNYAASGQYEKAAGDGTGYLPVYEEPEYTLSAERIRPVYELYLTGGKVPIEDMRLHFNYWDTIREICLTMFDGATAEEAAEAYTNRQMEQIPLYRD